MNDINYLKKYYKGNINDAIKRLEAGEPVQYIVGNVEFYGNQINVNKNVLIPRFETEELVDMTLKILRENFDDQIDILDIGTGSGCIAISLKKEIDANIDAVDISKDALDVAIENARLNEVNINFYRGDLLDNLTKKYDCIISNPPYLSKNDESVQKIVVNNEPHIALFAEDNGLKIYDQILKTCKDNLKNKSLIAFEIGHNQGEKLISLSKKTFPNAKVILKKDYNNFDRYIFIMNNF